MYKRPITDPEHKKASLKKKRTQKKKEEEIKAFKMPRVYIFEVQKIKPKNKYMKNVYKMFCYITLMSRNEKQT